MRRVELAITRVVDKGFCIGCGACSALAPDLRVQDAANGEKRVLTIPAGVANLPAASRVCPMGEAPSEDRLASIFLDGAERHAEGVGRYIDLYAGYSRDQRADGGSGGMARWLIAELLRRGEIDFVVQVDRKLSASASADLFFYQIHTSAENYLAHTSSSAYYPVSLDNMLKEIIAQPGTCLVTALPCFSRALRALMLEMPNLREKVVFISGVICGSLKSKRYAAYLAQQMGVGPNEVERLSFRGKSLAKAANEKCVEIWKSGSASTAPDAVARVQDLKGTNYGLGYFKYKGCDYCDDVFAETADISFGDAWIKPYSDDPKGTNIVVVRHPYLASLLAEARNQNSITLTPLTADQARQTQAGGLRHRRDGLRIRLRFAHLVGAWTPAKRVAPAWGHPLAIGVQLHRVVLRRLTSSTWFNLGSPAFERCVSVLNRLFRPIVHRETKRRQRIERQVSSDAP